MIKETVVSLDRVQPIPYKVVKPIGRAYVIEVNTQQDFDAINFNISKAIRAGNTNIRVKLCCDKYS